jgi:hypothetical protein
MTIVSSNLARAVCLHELHGLGEVLHRPALFVRSNAAR